MTALALSPAEAARLRADLDAANRRIQELTRANQRLIHERDALAEKVGEAVRVSRSEPALTVYCDTPQCTTQPLVSRALPPEDAIPQWIRGFGWTVDGEGHTCPRCSRAR